MQSKLQYLVTVLLVLMLQPSCKQYNTDYAEQANNPAFMHDGVRRITDIIRYDIFAPPVAARIYAYSVIAGYEAMRPGFSEYQTLAGQLNGLKPVPAPETGKDYCFPLAGVQAMLIVSKTLVFSEGNIEDLKEDILEKFKAMNMPPEVYERSMTYGEQVAKHILAWSKTDNYAQTRSAPKFTIDTKEPSRWRPTPPMYGDALEPHWCEMRTWVLDSCRQIKSDPHVAFSREKGSEFYKQAYEVYDIVKNLTPEQEAIAWYWDDNPFAIEVSGHLSIGKKKISPGGHWMTIAGYTCKKAGSDMMESAETYVHTACAIADAFIVCWDEKYRSNLIRPESYINELIDPEWTPLIQTPPFPEHISGHSTLSSAAAAVLTNLYGPNFAFTDSTEVEFGLPARSFNSFEEAAAQVGMSRLYGGIHYRRGNEAGLKCGKEIGDFVVKELKTRQNKGSAGGK